MNTKKDLLALQLGDLVEGYTDYVRQSDEAWLVTRVLTRAAAFDYRPAWLTKIISMRETPIHVVEFQSSSGEALTFVVLDHPRASNNIGCVVAANGELIDAFRFKSLDECRKQGTKFNVVSWVT